MRDDPTGRSRRRRRWRRQAHWLWRDWSWLAIVAAAGVVWLTGALALEARKPRLQTSEALYQSLQFFALESNKLPSPGWLLQLVRFVAPLVVAVATARLVIAVLRGLALRLAIFFRRDHVVICGLGERGTLLARRFMSHKDTTDAAPWSWWRRLRYGVVAIEENEQADGIEACRQEGVTVIIGDATDRYVLRKAGLEKARYLVAVGGPDGVNAEVAADAAKLVTGRGGPPLEAFVHVVDPRLSELLRERERSALARDSFLLRFFNVYESGARAWIERHPPFGEAGAALSHPAHLTIVGVGQLGKSLVLGAVRSLLTRRIGDRGSDGLGAPLGVPRITLVDKEATRKLDWLRVEFPQLESYCELTALEMDVNSPHFGRAEFLLDADGRPTVTAVYVCMDDDVASLTAALVLGERLRDAAVINRLEVPPVTVRLRRYAGLATLFGDDDHERGRAPESMNVRAFRLLDSTCTPEFLLGRTPNERLARAIHAIYVRMQEARGATVESNPAMAPWDELPAALKESNRRQAAHAEVKLETLGFSIDPNSDDEATSVALTDGEVAKLARMEHDRFEAERRFEGWTDGPRDALAKTSPYLVGWDDLPKDIQDYDVELVRELPRALREAGIQAYRSRRTTHG